MESKDTYHHKNLRNDLIEAGIALVAKEGMEGFSLRKVASACKVTHAAPYSHFANKDVLLEEMQDYITDSFSTELETTIAKCKKTENLLIELGQSYVRFFCKHPNYFIFLFGQANIALDLTDKAKPGQNYKPFEIFKSVIKEILVQNKYPEKKYNDAIIALWAFVHGVASLATMKNIRYKGNWEEKIKDFMHVFNCEFLENHK